MSDTRELELRPPWAVLETKHRSSATVHTLNNSIVSPAPRTHWLFMFLIRMEFFRLTYILCMDVLSIHHTCMACGGQKKAGRSPGVVNLPRVLLLGYTFSLWILLHFGLFPSSSVLNSGFMNTRQTLHHWATVVINKLFLGASNAW